MSSALTQTAKRSGSFFKKSLPSVSLAQLHAEHLDQCRAEGTRDTSVISYQANLRVWEQWCAAKGVELLADVTTALCTEFLREQRAAKLSDRTVRNRAIVIRAALKFAHREGYIKSQRLYGYEIPKAQRPSVYMASLQEAGVILSSIEQHWSVARNPASRFRNRDARTFFRARDQAIVAVQLSVGLRISETLGLRLGDYSQERRELNVTHSKTGAPRAVPVTPALAPYLAGWLRTRPAASPSDFLFVTEFGSQLHGCPWSKQFQRYLTFARSEAGGSHALPRVTLSSLRHIAATALAEAGGVYHASLLLGHSSTRVTEGSYIHRNTSIIRETHEAADPLAGILTNTRKAKQRPKKVV